MKSIFRIHGFWVAALLLCAFLFGVRPTFAQAPPPPPPAEGLDPVTAPKSSRDTVPAASAMPASVTASPASAPSGAPPPPSEGLDPATAPASSRETTAVTTAPSEAKPTPNASPAKSGGDSEDVEAPSVDAAGAKTSPVAVFRLDFMQRALSAGLLVGGVCAFLGVYVILRRIVFVGVALAEMSSAGVALSLLTRMPPMIGSVLVMFAGVLLFSVRWGGRRIRQDAFIGIGYVVASAAAVLLMAKSPSGEGSLLDLLFGNILTVSASEIEATAIALGIAVLCHFLFYKEMLFVAFDPDTAAASGYRSRLWEMLLYLTIGITIAFAIHAVGVMMTFAALVLPPVTALLLTRRMNTAFTTAIVLGMVPVPVGLYVSFVADLPAAPTVVVAYFAVLLIAGIIARYRH